MERKPRSRMAVQMKDVAAKAGVSITTVSHIANNTRPVAEQTRERVLRAMRQLGYHKNVFGRRLARGRSDAYGLLISDIENPFFPELIRSFETASLERGCDVLLFSTNYDPERARMAVGRLIENRVQGAAIMTSQLDSALIDELVENDIPVVRLDAPEPARGRARSNIRVNYATGAMEVTVHLRDLGHRNIAFIAGPQSRISARAYREVFLEVLRRLELPPARVLEGDNTMDGGATRVRALLEEPVMPTAILCGNDLAALGAMRALAEAGLRVPEDISIIGADDIAFARFSMPALTTIRVPRDALGRIAFEALDRMIRTKRRLGVHYPVETHLVQRQSTGPARP